MNSLHVATTNKVSYTKGDTSLYTSYTDEVDKDEVLRKALESLGANTGDFCDDYSTHEYEVEAETLAEVPCHPDEELRPWTDKLGLTPTEFRRLVISILLKGDAPDGYIRLAWF